MLRAHQYSSHLFPYCLCGKQIYMQTIHQICINVWQMFTNGKQTILTQFSFLQFVTFFIISHEYFILDIVIINFTFNFYKLGNSGNLIAIHHHDKQLILYCLTKVTHKYLHPFCACGHVHACKWIHHDKYVNEKQMSHEIYKAE